MRTIVPKYPVKLGRVEVHYIYVKNALGKTAFPGLNYSLNPYIGCSHGCVYCYAKLYSGFKSVSTNWGNVVYIKLNIHKVLENEVHRLKKGYVAVGTITDPYQPVEAIYGVTRRSIITLLDNDFKISIQTKNSLILRDVDILVKHKEKVDVGFTITTIDYWKSVIIEPYAPPPLVRINALKKIRSRGIRTWVFYGPVIPRFNDDEATVNEVMNVCLETGSKLYVDPLRIKEFMLDPNHILHKYIDHLDKTWINDFKRKVVKKCLEFGLECLDGFEESPLI